MKKEITEEQALARAAALCSQSEQCTSKIRKKLEQWGIGDDAQERILERLVEERYIDEARFARAYAHDKFQYNHWGPVRIDMELRKMGIASSIRKTVVSELPHQDQLDTLVALLHAKAKSVKARSEYERRGKLIRFALGRGFQMDNTLKALSRLGIEDDDPS